MGRANFNDNKNMGYSNFLGPWTNATLKGIFQPFELGGVTRLIRSAVKFWKAGN